jgi:ureidoacrylate peracid hydrolase
MATTDFEVLRTLEERVAPQHTALLIVDMQNDYCAVGGASDRNGRDLSMMQAAIPLTRRLIEAARAATIPVIWAKYTLGPGTAGLSGPELLRRGANFANADATIKGTWGHDIVADLPDEPDDVVIEKRRVSCFIGTDLDMLLRAAGIKTLVVTGCVTQTCVETTVRDAACYDYYVAVPEDCVASTSPAAQATSLQNMATFLRYQDAITTSERIMAVWAAAPAAAPAPVPAAPA